MMLRNGSIRELLMLVPNLAILLGKLALDKRVSAETKALLGAGALYLVSPIDGIPDFIPVLGQLDDVLVALVLVDIIVNQIDPEVVREHWRGDLALLEKVQGLAGKLTGLMPQFVRDRILHRAASGKAAGAVKRMGSLARMAGGKR